MNRKEKLMKIVSMILYPWLAWIFLFVMELPLYRWYWAFGIHEYGAFAYIIPLFVYLIFALFGTALAVLIYPLHLLLCRSIKIPSFGFTNWNFAFNIWLVIFILITNRLALAFKTGTSLDNAPVLYIILGILLSFIIIGGIFYALTRKASEQIERPFDYRILILVGVGLYFISVAFSSARVMSSDRSLRDNPNVLLITLDTTNVRYLPRYGAPDYAAPNLARLMDKSIVFENTYSCVPLTTPSHASILSGAHPQIHRAYTNESTLKYQVRTAQEYFRSKGYITGGFPSAFCVTSHTNFNQGFDYFADRQLGDDLRTSILRYLAPYRFLEIVLNRQIGRPAIPDNADAKLVNKRFLRWVNKNSDKRWFAWLHYFDLHAPYLPPTEADHPRSKQMGDFDQTLHPASVESLSCLFGTRYFSEHNIEPLQLEDRDIEFIRDLYRGEVEYMDSAIGDVIKKLEELDIMENTIIAIVGDHGEGLYERGYFGHNYFLNEDEILVPMVLYIPSKIWEKQDAESVNQLLRKNVLEENVEGLLHLPSEYRIDHLVKTIDLYPTILDFAGFPAPSVFKHGGSKHAYGLSLRELIEMDPDLLADWNRPAISQIFIYSRAVRVGDWKLIWGLNTGDRVFKYDCEAYRLYNLREDPGEHVNLAEANPAKLTEMRGILETIMNELEGKRNFTQIPFGEYLDQEHDTDKDTLEILRGLGYLSGATLDDMFASGNYDDIDYEIRYSIDEDQCGCRGSDDFPMPFIHRDAEFNEQD